MDPSSTEAGPPEAGPAVPFRPPETFNIAEYFLGDRLREGTGDRIALRTGGRDWTYAETDAYANRFGNLLLRAGVRPEERVLIALPDGPELVAALFGTLRIGAVGVLLNPHLKPDEIAYAYGYSRARVLLVSDDRAVFFRDVADRIKAEDRAAGDVSQGAGGAAASGSAGAGSGEGDGPRFASGGRFPLEIHVIGGAAFRERLDVLSEDLETFPTHRDDPALWIFSGGTTGRPKAAVQSHASFANTTECYGKGVLHLEESDITLSVPKLYFGYAMGSNLFFPFSVGASCVLFPERSTPETVLAKIEAHRPTVLVNVPTMINLLLADPASETADLSSLRLATSAGEALPPDLHRRWSERFGVDLVDGLGTAEMWHIFLSNRPGDVRPGTLGRVVPGFEVRVRDDDGRDLPDGEVGWLWVRGGSRAIGYWQRAEASRAAFRGEWYASGDMIVRDADGVFTYYGRGDDMLKVKGKWLSPREVEDCLLQHEGVREAAVVGVTNADGLLEPRAWVVPAGAPDPGLAEALRAFVGARLASYKAPTRVTLVDDLPRTHLGKVDRSALRASADAGR